MRILLINPSSKSMINANLPSFVEEERGVYPPLGLLYVASSIESSGHKVKFLDLETEKIDFISEIKKFKPEIVGLTATTFNLINTLSIVKRIKKVLPDTKIALGGVHATIYPSQTLKLGYFDYIIREEGELTFKELLNKDLKSLEKIKGLSYLKGKKLVHNNSRSFIKNLDKLPFPARHLTKVNKYYSLIAKKNPITTIISSRGCPYNCIFCNRPQMGKVFRARSPKNVVDEIEECVNSFNIKEFFFYDDTFTINKKRVIDICRLIAKRGLKISWDIRTRVNLIDEAMIKGLKNSGCDRIHFGVESGSQRVLNNLRKGVTLEQINTAFKLTKKYKIKILADFMIGNPGESKKQILKTIDYAKKLDPNYAHFSITTPYPATDLYSLGLSKSLFKDFWAGFASKPKNSFKPRVWEEKLSEKELKGFLKQAYKSFYVRPSYIIKDLIRTRSLKGLLKKMKAGLKILTRI